MGRSTSRLPPRRVSSARRRVPRGYADHSMRPVTVLAFLAPMLLAYEIGSVKYLLNGAGLELTAHRLLAEFFHAFGALGIHLPAFSLVAVFLVLHLRAGDSWRVRPGTLVVMAGESVLLACPLLVLALILGRSATAAGTDGAVETLPMAGKLTLAFGAGLYEEMLFRLIGLNLAHALAIALLRTPDFQAKALALVVTAVAFSLVHDLSALGGGERVLLRLYFIGAGIYFGLIYLVRGFGVAVGAHAAYDLMVLLAIDPTNGG